jgi:transposase
VTQERVRQVRQDYKLPESKAHSLSERAAEQRKLLEGVDTTQYNKRQLADKLGISIYTISNWKARGLIKTKPSQWGPPVNLTPEKLALADGTRNYKQLADLWGVHYITVYRNIKKYGLKIRRLRQ